MITKKQALTENRFHYITNGNKCQNWRRNGQTKTWKTRSDEFRVPVKYGMYDYDYITNDMIELPNIYVESECPHTRS